MIRASVYLDGSKMEVRALGGKETRFIAVELDDLVIYFEHYGMANVVVARELGKKLVQVALEMEHAIALDQEAEAEMESLISPEPIDRFGRGVSHDTLEEHRGEK